MKKIIELIKKNKIKSISILVILVLILFPLIIDIVYTIGEKHALYLTFFEPKDILNYGISFLSLLATLLVGYFAYKLSKDANNIDKKLFDIAANTRKGYCALINDEENICVKLFKNSIIFNFQNVSNNLIKKVELKDIYISLCNKENKIEDIKIENLYNGLDIFNIRINTSEDIFPKSGGNEFDGSMKITLKIITFNFLNETFEDNFEAILKYSYRDSEEIKFHLEECCSKQN